MADVVTMKVEGFRELEKALEQFSQSVGRGVMRRALKKAAQPIADAMRSGAPEDEGDLKESIAVSTKLSDRQKRMHKKMFSDDKASVEMFVGAGPLPQAHLQEFGTVDQSPQPFARPAWDSNKNQALETIKTELWSEIEKSAARAARKTARQQARG